MFLFVVLVGVIKFFKSVYVLGLIKLIKVGILWVLFMLLVRKNVCNFFL